MANFNAGAIEGTLDLDRSPFLAGMKLARAQAKRFEDTAIKAKVDLDAVSIQHKIKEIEDKPVKINADTTAADAKLAALEAKHDKFDFDLDTDRAERSLKEFEKQAKIRVGIDEAQVKKDLAQAIREEKFDFSLDTDRAERDLARFEREAALKIKLDDAEAKHKLKELTDDRKVEIKADLDRAKARTQLAILARNRRMKLFVDIANFTKVKAQLASLGKMTLALSGYQVIQKRLSALKDNLENLDKLAYTMGGLTYLFGNIINVLGSVSASVFSLIGNLGQLGGFLVGLPAMIAALSISVIASVIAFNGFFAAIKKGGKDLAALPPNMREAAQAVRDLEPAWKKMKETIQENFWVGVGDSISNLTDKVMPAFSAGLASSATSMGNFFKGVMDSMAAVKPEIYEKMFAGVASSIDIANGAISPLINAFTILGTVGSDNLDRLSGWFVDISNQFNNFISEASADGRLQLWLDNAATAFADLGTVLGQLGGIFNGVTEAFKNAGSSTLETLAVALTRIHEIVDSPAFQTALTTIFTGVLAGASALADALGPIGDAFAAMAPTIAYLAEQIGVVLGGALTGIAGAIATPAFQTGLTGFFDGIAAGIQGIIPFLPQIAAGFGALGTVAGAILANVGPALGVLLAGLGDAIVAALPSILTVVEVLGGALMDAITTLMPAVTPLVVVIGELLAALSPVLADLVGSLAEAIVILVQALIPVVEAMLPIIPIIGQLAPLIGEILIVAVTSLGEILVALTPIITLVIDAFSQILAAVIPLIPTILGLYEQMVPLVLSILPLIVQILPLVVDLFMQLLNMIIPILPSLVEMAGAVIQLAVALMPLISALLPPLISLLGWVIGLVTPLIGLLAQGLTAAFTWVAEKITMVAGKITEFTAKLTEGWTSVTNFVGKMADAFNGIKEKVLDKFNGAKDWLKNIAADIIEGLTSGVTAQFDKVKGVFGALTDMIPDWKGPKERDKKLLRPAANMIMGGFVDQIDKNRSSLRDKLAEVTDDIKLNPDANLNINAKTINSGNGVNSSAFNDRQWVEMMKALNDTLGAVTTAAAKPMVGGDLILQAREKESVASQFDTAMFKIRTIGSAGVTLGGA